MATVQLQRIRIVGDSRDPYSKLDAATSETPAFSRGVGLNIDLRVDNNGTLASVANMTSVTCVIKALGIDGGAPSSSSAALMSKTVESGSMDDTLDASSWTSESKQHARFTFSSSETNLAAGTHWLLIHGVRTDTTRVTLVATKVEIEEDGGGATEDPPTPTTDYYTKDEIDAAFVRLDSLGLQRKVSVPTTNLTAGEQGDFAFDTSAPPKLYIYTGDGSSHSWLVLSGGDTFDNS